MGEAEHWGPVEAAWPTPDAELNDIELGFRVDWWAVMGDMASLYSTQDAREWAWTLNLWAQVCEGAKDAGRPIPEEWQPACVGDES